MDNTVEYPSIEVNRPIAYGIDLGHLAVFDINHTDNLSAVTGSEDPEVAIKANVRDGIQSLINAIWKQPVKPSDDHVSILASLPVPQFPLPREKPVPLPDKTKTRWQKFAQEKGIQKAKRSRLIYDDKMQDWVPRHGYKGAKFTEQDNSDWLIEVKNGQDPYEDLYQKRRDEKRSRVEKNKKQQLRNQDAAQATKKGVSISDVRSAKKVEIERSLKVTGKSTASMGKFDKALDTKGAIKLKAEKRKFEVVDASKQRAIALKAIKD